MFLLPAHLVVRKKIIIELLVRSFSSIYNKYGKYGIFAIHFIFLLLLRVKSFVMFWEDVIFHWQVPEQRQERKQEIRWSIIIINNNVRSSTSILLFDRSVKQSHRFCMEMRHWIWNAKKNRAKATIHGSNSILILGTFHRINIVVAFLAVPYTLRKKPKKVNVIQFLWNSFAAAANRFPFRIINIFLTCVWYPCHDMLHIYQFIFKLHLFFSRLIILCSFSLFFSR